MQNKWFLADEMLGVQGMDADIKAAFVALDALRVRMDKQMFRRWLRGLKATHPALRGEIAALLRHQGR